MEQKGSERRTSIRKQVLQTFHVFIVINKAGSRKIYLKDISEGGVAFFSDAVDNFHDGSTFDCSFFVNPSLHIPLKMKVAHAGHQVIGCEITDRSSEGYKAYQVFS